MDQEKRSKGGFEVLPSIKKRLKAIANDRDMKLWELTEQVFLAFLEVAEPPQKGDTKAPQSRQGKLPIEFPSPLGAELQSYRAAFSKPQNLKMLGMLARVLESGVGDAISAVQQNLEVFSKYIEGQGPDETGPTTKRKGPKK